MVEFKDPAPIPRKEIVKIFSSGSNDEICSALVSMSFYEEDWKWAQDRCLYFLDHPDADVRGTAVTCLGHIARIHNKLDREEVVQALKNHLHDEAIAGRIEDALDDIQMFL